MMSGMIYRLDPAVPMVWRDPHTLQLGVDRVVCVFPQTSATTERMLAALRSGVPRSVLELEAASDRRMDPAEHVSALLASVADALEAAETGPAMPIVLDGTGPTSERVRRLLREAGHPMVSAEPSGDAEHAVGAAVLIGSYVIPPWRHGPWLRRDVPHLPVVFGDDGVDIGPFVDTDGPCLRCLSLERRDADPAWPAIATQLAGHAPAPEPPLLSAHAAALAARWVEARVRAGDRSHAATSVHLGVDGSVSEHAHPPHALCGCRALPENVTALVARQRSWPSSATASSSRA